MDRLFSNADQFQVKGKPPPVLYTPAAVLTTTQYSGTTVNQRTLSAVTEDTQCIDEEVPVAETSNRPPTFILIIFVCFSVLLLILLFIVIFRKRKAKPKRNFLPVSIGRRTDSERGYITANDVTRNQNPQYCESCHRPIPEKENDAYIYLQDGAYHSVLPPDPAKNVAEVIYNDSSPSPDEKDNVDPVYQTIYQEAASTAASTEKSFEPGLTSITEQ